MSEKCKHHADRDAIGRYDGAWLCLSCAVGDAAPAQGEKCPHLRVNGEYEATGGFILELGDRCLDCGELVNRPASPPVVPAHETPKNTDTPDGKAQGAIRFYESPHQEVARILPDGTVVFPAHEGLRAEIEKVLKPWRGMGTEPTEILLLRRCRAALSAPEDFRNGCACSCCDHGEGSDCGCDCHAEGKCAYQPTTPSVPGSLVERLKSAKHSAMGRHGYYPSVIDEAIAVLSAEPPQTEREKEAFKAGWQWNNELSAWPERLRSLIAKWQFRITMLGHDATGCELAIARGISDCADELAAELGEQR